MESFSELAQNLKIIVATIFMHVLQIRSCDEPVVHNLIAAITGSVSFKYFVSVPDI